MGLLPMEQFLCWKLKVATVITAYYTVGAASFALFMEILDIAAHANKNFDIQGSFRADWRMHVWEGWLACNIVMFCCHLGMIGYSVLVVFAVKRFPTYYEFNITKAYFALMIMYILVELGVSLYRYSWLPWLVFSFLYWLIRSLINITCTVVLHSRIAELDYEINVDEIRNLSEFASSNALLRSGRATPSGYATPRSAGYLPPKQPYGPPGQSYA